MVDGATLSVVAVIPSASAAAAGSFSPVYRKLYLASPADDSVTVIDVDSATVSATLRVGGSPQEVFVDDDAGTLYVPNRGNASVSVIDPQHEQVMGSLRASAFASRIALAAVADRLVVVGDRENAGDTATFTTKPALVPDTAIAVEYFAPASGRYFHTADANDRRLLDDGVLGRSWQPTQQYWRVWTVPQPDRMAVYWIGGTDAGGLPLFVAGAPCSAIDAAHDGREIAVYYVARPDASGACAPGTEPLYRVDDARGGSAPRLTPDRSVRDAMQANGWVARGVGFDTTYACTPSLRASAVDGFVPPDVGQPPMSRIPYPIGPVPRPKAFVDELAAVATISRPGIPFHMNPF